MPYLALILFLPWFAVLGALFWLFPRLPRTRARRLFDAVAPILAFALGFVGMQWGYAQADVAADPIWKQVLACLIAYGAGAGGWIAAGVPPARRRSAPCARSLRRNSRTGCAATKGGLRISPTR